MSSETVTFKGEETGAEKPNTTDDQNTNSATEQAERPSWLPENFKTVEDYIKSNDETKATLTRAQQELAALKKGKGEETTTNDNNTADNSNKSEAEKAAEAAVEKAGIDVVPYQQEFNESGTVSEEGRAKLAEQLAGVFPEGTDTRALVDDFIEGQAMRLDNFRSEVMSTAGGEEQYRELMEWAKSSLSEEQIASFNAAVDSSDINAARLAVEGLTALYVKENGNAPSLIDGKGASGESAGFANAYEMRQAMSKTNEKGERLYKVDPVYRKRVEARAQISNF